jgi:hypothetical protein
VGPNPLAPCNSFHQMTVGSIAPLIDLGEQDPLVLLGRSGRSLLAGKARCGPQMPASWRIQRAFHDQGPHKIEFRSRWCGFTVLLLSFCAAGDALRSNFSADPRHEEPNTAFPDAGAKAHQPIAPSLANESFARAAPCAVLDFGWAIPLIALRLPRGRAPASEESMQTIQCEIRGSGVAHGDSPFIVAGAVVSPHFGTGNAKVW